MNSDKSNIEDQLLIRFIQGDTSMDEQSAIKEWLESDEDNQRHFERLQQVWENSGSVRVFDQIDLDKNWQDVQGKLELDQSAGGKQVFMLPTLIRYAAGILLLATIAFLIPRFSQPSADLMTLTASFDGQSFELPDGTDVWLNSGSQLVYPTAFANDERSVKLMGEAYFEVEHNPKHPFVVQAGQTETRVLGTSFNLRESNGTEPTELVLVTGKVQFSIGKDQVLLAPGDRVIVNALGALVKEVNEDPNFMAWKTRTLIFENTKMEQVLQEVAELYNIEINIEQSSFGACPLTTRFENESLQNVFETIELLFGVEIISQNGSLYTISGAGC